MKKISILIKPASSKCNMQCNYCFYSDISKKRKQNSIKIKTDNNMDKMINNILKDLNYGDELIIAFQGGEPTLAGVDYYKKFIEKIEKNKGNVNIKYVIQTNGFDCNEEMMKIFMDNDFLVGLSLDCNELIHDIHRKDIKGCGTFERVMKTKIKLDKMNIKYNILTVLTSELSAKAKDVFEFIVTNNVKYVQFIPCLGSLNGKDDADYSLKPKEFYNFYSVFFKCWFDELKKGNYISVKLFDDILMLMLYGEKTACGITGECNMQNIIESDGTVYPCDFYALDEFEIGSIFDKGLKELFNSDITKKFMHSRKEFSDICKKCKFFDMCFGGCKRMEGIYIDSFDGICYYSKFLEKFLGSFNEVIDAIKGIIY